MKKWQSIFIIGLVFVSGCQMVNPHVQNQGDVYQASNQQQNQSPTSQNQTVSKEKSMSLDSDQVLIQTGAVSYETVDYKKVKQQVMEWARQEGFTIQYQNEYGYASSNADQSVPNLRNLNLTIRLPKDQFEQVMNQLGSRTDFGKLVSSTQGAQDVTKESKDLDLRLKSIDKRIERLNQLLDKAENVADIITVQNSLDEAILQRDQLLSEQSTLNDQVDLATITLDLREVTHLADGTSSPAKFGQRVLEAFGQLGSRFIYLLQNLILAFIYALPYLFLLGIFIWLARLFIKKSPKHRGHVWKLKSNNFKLDKTENKEK